MQGQEITLAQANGHRLQGWQMAKISFQAQRGKSIPHIAEVMKVPRRLVRAYLTRHPVFKKSQEEGSASAPLVETQTQEKIHVRRQRTVRRSHARKFQESQNEKHVAFAYGYTLAWLEAYARSHGLSASVFTQSVAELLSLPPGR